jgi:hypothetical protein
LQSTEEAAKEREQAQRTVLAEVNTKITSVSTELEYLANNAHQSQLLVQDLKSETTANIVCNALTICADSEYMDGWTDNGNRECATITDECNYTTEYEQQAPTANSDRVDQAVEHAALLLRKKSSTQQTKLQSAADQAALQQKIWNARYETHGNRAFWERTAGNARWGRCHRAFCRAFCRAFLRNKNARWQPELAMCGCGRPRGLSLWANC